MPKNIPFRESLKRLEEIVEKLESQDVDLEEGLKLLTEGLKLHKMCEQKLKSAQTQINRLITESGVK